MAMYCIYYNRPVLSIFCVKYIRFFSKFYIFSLDNLYDCCRNFPYMEKALNVN